MAKYVLALAVVTVGAVLWWSCNSCSLGPLPQLDQEEWWGPKELQGRVDTTIKPFQIKFDPKMIQDLRDRIKKHRSWTPPLEGVGFQYGFNSKQLDGWLNYWSDKYNFSEREKFLNQFPQFKTNIQGLDIHFIRVKPKVPSDVQIVPLLLMHGWPGSVREFYEAIPLLTRHTPGYNFAFEVIVPSLPGYGFSSAAVRPGLGTSQVAVVFKNLMSRLGFKKFYIQGGDWGAVIASAMATLFPDDILGHHTNMASERKGIFRILLGAFFPSTVVEPHLADRMYPLSKFFAHLMEEFGYFHLQATKPDTVGVALTDSPSGLLAYILEKFSTWTRVEFRNTPDGNLGFRFSKDQLIDNLMIYWSTNSITTSMRLYAETMSQKHRDLNLEKHTTPVPTWALQAKHEIFYSPPSILRMKYTNLIDTTVLDDGGHFLAFELPQVFVHDVFKAVKTFREWHKNNVRTEL